MQPDGSWRISLPLRMHTLQDANRSNFSKKILLGLYHWCKVLCIPPMSSSCPTAPLLAPGLSLETISLRSGTILTRCHKGGYPANSFNPNTGSTSRFRNREHDLIRFLALRPPIFQLFMRQTHSRRRHWKVFFMTFHMCRLLSTPKCGWQNGVTAN